MSILIHSGSAAKYVLAPQLLTTTWAGAYVEDFVLQTISNTSVGSGSVVSSSILKDVLFNIVSGSSTKTTTTMSVQQVIGDQSFVPSYTSITPSLSTVDVNGNLGFVSNGNALINVKVERRTKQATCPMFVFQTITQTFAGLNTQSLAYSASFAIDNRIQSLSPTTTSYNIYSSSNYGTLVFTRNSSLWLSSVDLTCLPVYNSSTGTSFNGILVSPDILIQANHGHPPSGSVMYFVDGNNTTISSSVSAGSNPAFDVWVCKLSTPVSASITPAVVFGDATHITQTAQTNGGLPVGITNQFATVRIAECQTNLGSSGLNIVQSLNPTRSIWYSPVVGGDSGAPFFAIINNRVVALGTNYTSNFSNSSFGPSILCFFSAISASLASLGSIYNLTTASLGSFPNYP